MKCEFCGKHTRSYSRKWIDGNPFIICDECQKKEKAEKIERDLEAVKNPEDFKTWKKADMSEAFWVHLGRYKKKPNKRSLEVMYVALLWAYHDDHGLSNSFSHALKWCGIDLFAEQQRKDLPETDKDDFCSYGERKGGEK